MSTQQQSTHADPNVQSQTVGNAVETPLAPAAPAVPPAVPAAEQPTQAQPANATVGAEPTSDQTSEDAPAKSKKTVILTTDTFKKLKTEQREKGAKAERAKLDAEAVALGFKSHADMVDRALRANGKAPAKGSPPARAPAPPPPVELQQKLRTTESNVRKLKREQEALRAEMVLREAAIRAGVVDVDYALHLVRQEFAGKTAEQLANFDEDVWFASLRKTRPTLFAAVAQVEQVEPTTGVSGAGNVGVKGGAVPPNPPAAPPAPAKPVDVRSMSRREYEAYLQSRGITNPAIGRST